MMKKQLMLLLGILAIPALVQAGDPRYYNHGRVAKEKQKMIESVEILDLPHGTKPDKPYKVIKSFKGYDMFTQTDDYIVNNLRYEAAKLKANALFELHCWTEHSRLKVCKAQAIQWE